jgi:hypothetical protein
MGFVGCGTGRAGIFDFSRDTKRQEQVGSRVRVVTQEGLGVMASAVTQSLHNQTGFSR